MMNESDDAAPSNYPAVSKQTLMPMVWTEVMDNGAPDLALSFAQEYPPKIFG